MKLGILSLLVASVVLSGVADGMTIDFFNSSQTATLEATGETSDTISSNGYLFTIRITDYAYPEYVLVDKKGLVINLIGGCDEGFTACATTTAIQGALEIVNGTAIVDNIVVEM